MARKLRGAAAAAAAQGAIKTQQLIDYAISMPEGFTAPDAMRDLEWSREVLHDAIRRARRQLAYSGDSMTLTMEHDGKQAVFRLIGTMTELAPYAAANFMTWEKNFDRVTWMLGSVTRGLRADCGEARRAQIFQKHLRRLLEDLADLRKEDMLF